MRGICRAVVAGAVAAVVVAGAAPAAHALTLAPPTVTPETVDAPGRAVVKIPVGTMSLTPAVLTFTVGTSTVRAGKFSGESDTVAVRSARLEGPGTLRVEREAVAKLAPSCVRGGVRTSSFKTWRLDLPASSTTFLVIEVDVPQGLDGDTASISIDPVAEQAESVVAPQPDLAATEVEIPRTGTIDGVSLKASKRAGERVRFTGFVDPPRKGAKVAFVGRKLGSSSVDSLFGSERSALAPLGKTLKAYGTATTDKSGRFAQWLTVPKGLAMVARTSGADAGASCGVDVR